MQAKLAPQSRNNLPVRGFQFNPDKTIGLADMVADIVKRDGLDFSVLEKKAVDDGTWLQYQVSG